MTPPSCCSSSETGPAQKKPPSTHYPAVIDARSVAATATHHVNTARRPITDWYSSPVPPWVAVQGSPWAAPAEMLEPMPGPTVSNPGVHTFASESVQRCLPAVPPLTW